MKPVWLAPNEPRCVPTACTKGEPCARKAIAQAMGRPQRDFSVAAGATVADCYAGNAWPRFVAIRDAVKPAEQKRARDWIGQ